MQKRITVLYCSCRSFAVIVYSLFAKRVILPSALICCSRTDRRRSHCQTTTDFKFLDPIDKGLRAHIKFIEVINQQEKARQAEESGYLSMPAGLFGQVKLRGVRSGRGS